MCVPGRGSFCDVRLEVLVEVAVFQVLDQHTQRLLPGTHPDHLHDVGVPQPRQDFHFTLEVTPAAWEMREGMSMEKINLMWNGMN